VYNLNKKPTGLKRITLYRKTQILV